MPASDAKSERERLETRLAQLDEMASRLRANRAKIAFLMLIRRLYSADVERMTTAEETKDDDALT